MAGFGVPVEAGDAVAKVVLHHGRRRSLLLPDSRVSYNGSMCLRLATLEDLPGIMQIVTALIPLLHAVGNLQWDDTYPNPRVFAEDIANGQLWVKAVGDRIAGVVAPTTEQYPEYADAGWDVTDPAIVVHRLAVNPEFQRQGIAAALLSHAEVVARSRNFSRVLADTNSHNQAMQRLLPKLGYTLAGEITLAFRPGMRFLCYEKLLKD